MLTGIRAVVFDAVGTLIHPEPAAPLVYAAVGCRYGSQRTSEEIAVRFREAFRREEAFDREHGWRITRVAEIDRQLAHHWATVTLQTVRADDPQAWKEVTKVVFDEIQVKPYRVVAYQLPDTEAIADYLHAFNVENWHQKASAIESPLTITKVGAQVWARR